MFEVQEEVGKNRSRLNFHFSKNECAAQMKTSAAICNQAYVTWNDAVFIIFNHNHHTICHRARNTTQQHVIGKVSPISMSSIPLTASSLHPACLATLNWRGAGVGWLLELHRWGRDSWRSSSALDILYLCRRLFLVDGWRCVCFDHGPAILVPTVWVWIRNHERQGAAYVPSFSLSCAAATF